MKRGFPGKDSTSQGAINALTMLLTQARTLDHFTPEGLVKSYGVPLEQVTKMLDEAKRRRDVRERLG